MSFQESAVALLPHLDDVAAGLRSGQLNSSTPVQYHEVDGLHRGPLSRFHLAVVAEYVGSASLPDVILLALALRLGQHAVSPPGLDFDQESLSGAVAASAADAELATWQVEQALERVLMRHGKEKADAMVQEMLWMLRAGEFVINSVEPLQALALDDKKLLISGNEISTMFPNRPSPSVVGTIQRVQREHLIRFPNSTVEQMRQLLINEFQQYR